MTQVPSSEATEQSLLGAVMLKPEILGWLDVEVEHFHGPKNRSVWRAMTALHDRGMAIDEVTLDSELERMGVQSAVGVAYLGQLAITTPTAANAASYAEMLSEHRVSREVMGVAANALAKIQSGDLAGEELLDSTVADLAQISRRKSNERTDVAGSVRELVVRMIDEVDARAKGLAGSSLVPTGIRALDARIGGIPLATVTAIGGRPGSGKSSMLLNVAEHAARLGKVVAIFTTEDPRDRWNERLLARHTGVSVDRLYGRTLKPHELQAASRAADSLRELEKLHIIHAHGMGAQGIIRTSMALGAELVAVDYIQKLKTPAPKMKLHEAIEQNAKLLGDYAGKSGSGVIVASQLSKDIEREQRRPTTGDLRYGDGLVQEAKLILLLHNPKSDAEQNQRELLVAKRNQGESDMLIPVRFEGAQCRFT